MESKKINQLATELTPSLSDLTIIGDPSTGISKKITLSQMASLFTGTVEEYASLAAFPLVGVADTIYIALDTNVLYRWNTGTNAYVELSPNIINSLVFNDANGFDGTIALVGSVATLTITTALTTGSVGFIGASGALLQDNANFFWDDTNNRLGIGTNAPTTAIDVFGSGIIGRLNGTSTNNAFLGFASAGTNKWSIGNVQADHRFRIYNDATTSELVSVLQTGEFGIGIANPTTKLHIDGGASALIANLDADVSIAKSLSFRSDNSNRINLEVSGTESGSNAGANFYLRTYTDAGSLLATPLTIERSTGNATFSGILITPQVKAATSAGLSINANSGTQVADFGAGGSANITFFGGLSGTSATFSGIVSETKTADGIIQKIGGNTTKANIYQFTSGGLSGAVFNIGHNFYYDGTNYGQDNTAKSGWITSSNLNSDTFSISRAAAGSTSAPTSYLTINSTGNVGIGTGNPDRFFHINANTSTTTAIQKVQNVGTGDAVTEYRVPGVSWYIGNDASDAGKFKIGQDPLGTSDRFVIADGGNIGIGTSTPTNGKLEVQTGATSAGLWVQTGGTTSSYTIADFRNGSNASALRLLGNGKIVINSTSIANTGLGDKTKHYIVGDGSTNAAASHGSMFVAAGTGTADTGISINTGTSGMTMILIASINTSTGTSTNSAVYIVRFYFDGNNTPTATYIGGSSDFVTVGKSGSNTLTITGSSSGNKSYAWFVNKFGDT